MDLAKLKDGIEKRIEEDRESLLVEVQDDIVALIEENYNKEMSEEILFDIRNYFENR